MHSEAKRQFLNSEVFSMTLAATAQRSNMYAPGLSEEERRPLQKSLREALETTAAAYSASVTEDDHVRNIGALASTLSRRHSNLLAEGKMRFGHAQKALNLYLKYLWCLEKLPMPPHCPIDSVILRKIPRFTQVRWTKLASPDKYQLIIAAAKARAAVKGLPLAVWELYQYNSDT